MHELNMNKTTKTYYDTKQEAQEVADKINSENRNKFDEPLRSVQRVLKSYE